MDLAKLKENVVEETITYRGEKIVVGIKPDVFTAADADLPTVEYIVKGLDSWDITNDGDALEISAETLQSLIPEALRLAIFDRILEVRDAGMGKLKKLNLGQSANP